MITYKYSAISKDGAKVNGVIKAIDEYQAIDRIKAQYPIVVKIDEVKDSVMNRILNFEIGKKFDAKALSVMCSQFGIVLESGMAIDECLKMIAAQTKDKKIKKMLELSAEDVSQGTPIATAFEKNYPDLPVTFLETIRAGEVSGTLDKSFTSLADFYERSYTLEQKVKSAMSYPLFVLGVAVVVLIVVMAFVMPTFTSMFDELGGELPGITKVLISMTNFFQKWWLLIISIIILLVVAVILYKRTETGRMKWAELMLKLPVFGNLNILQASTEFASTMATLLKAGLTVGDALNVTSKVIQNYAIATDVKSMEEKIKTGQELGNVIRANKYFPQVLKEMTAVGEKTGELEATLDTIASYYNNEYNYAVSQAISKLEPAMLIVLALFAGFIVIALYLPMFTMYNLM
ncbi:MAG: type II secretion system F family protein [Erysipelotrichaceae bacterium]|nr:type II secretion system F family protein [Erysipelotrichaceae bacterium]